MKKRMIWLTTAGLAFGACAGAEVVITSPTGTPDESDVVLEAAVDAVKELPFDAAKVVVDSVEYIGDEIRNTAHGVVAPFKRKPTRDKIRNEMLNSVTDEWDTTGDILYRSYEVSQAIVRAMELKGVSEGAFLDVRKFFNGVDFQEDTSAYLHGEYRQVMVRNTSENLQRVESILATYVEAAEEYKQVEINAKFIEVSQSALNQLGFSWRIKNFDAGNAFRLDDHVAIPDNQDLFSAGLRTAAGAFGGGVPAVGSVVLTKSGWMPLKVAITALEQASDSDVLSAPSLTTRDGEEAEMWVGEDRMLPSEFRVNSSEINIHIQHEGWDSKLLGVYFSVTPQVRDDDVIRLDLKPKIIDLLGYDTYQVSPEGSRMYANQLASGKFPLLNLPEQGASKIWNMVKATLETTEGSPKTDPNDYSGSSLKAPYYHYQITSIKSEHGIHGTPIKRIYGQLPYFRVREIETKVDVADGSTVGLGGLVYNRLETYKDKVPVLGSIPLIGRLFRSEGERSIKRNLMIFVSATQVADNGVRKSGLNVEQPISN